MQNLPPVSRRRFLTQIAFAGTVPFIARNWAATAPSNRLRHASFGAAGMAWSDVNALARHPSIEIVAVADVDLNRTAEFRQKFPKAKVYQDWRELLAEQELDSVNVSTPDHMHAPIGMTAMRKKLHVYGQKPLSHDIYESRQLTNVAKELGLVTQMGIQIHSNAEYRMAVRLIQDGAIGKVKEVHTWSNKKWGDTDPRPDRADPIPEGLNWNDWIGVCAERPFIGKGWYHPSNWRKRLDFGTGTFGDMGCHIYDPVFKALALTAPVSVLSTGPTPNQHSWAINAVIEYLFPGTAFTAGDTVKVTWYDGDQKPPKWVETAAEVTGDPQTGAVRLPGQGSVFLGTEGVMVLPHIGWPQLLPSKEFKGYALPDVGSANHWEQFVDTILGKAETSANFSYSGPLTEAVLLGSVATRFPRVTLKWDAPGIRFTNQPEANQFVRRAYRKGWEVEGL